MKNNFLFILSAPSGGGKTTIERYILSKFTDLVPSVSVTTRQPRSGEKEGIDYFFKTKEEYNKMIENNEFMEYFQVLDNLYGTPLNFVKQKVLDGKNVLFNIDWQGARKIRKYTEFNIISIFLCPPSYKILEDRLIKRGDNPEIICKRMESFEETVSHANEYDYIVINDNLEKTLQDVISIYTTSSLLFQKSKYLEYIQTLKHD